MLPVSRVQFLTTFVLPPAESTGGRLYWWPCLLPVYVGTAPGPDVRGGLSHILLAALTATSSDAARRWLMAVHSFSSPLTWRSLVHAEGEIESGWAQALYPLP